MTFFLFLIDYFLAFDKRNQHLALTFTKVRTWLNQSTITTALREVQTAEVVLKLFFVCIRTDFQACLQWSLKHLLIFLHIRRVPVRKRVKRTCLRVAADCIFHYVTLSKKRSWKRRIYICILKGLNNYDISDLEIKLVEDRKNSWVEKYVFQKY